MEENVRSLLMRAWHGRWSPAKFSVQCKRTISPMLSTSVLAEILLTEALVGTASNDLFFSYLQQLLTSQSIPLDRVLISATQFDDLQKPRVLLDLINFLKRNSRLFFKDVPTQAIVQHCDLLAGHVTWLFVLMYKVMLKMSESERVDHSGIYSSILVSSCDVIETVTLSRSRMMVMSLAKRVTNADTYQTLRENATQLSALLPYLSDRRPDIVQRMGKCISACEKLEVEDLQTEQNSHGKLFLLTSPSSTIASLITIEALGNPCRSHNQLVRYFRLYKTIQKLEGPVIVDEILRACVSGLLESEDLERIYFISFTYIKLPGLLSQLCSTSPPLITPDDITRGLDMLLAHSALLNKAEHTLREPNMMGVLINELVKLNLVSAGSEVVLREKLNSLRVTSANSIAESPVARVYSCYSCIDDIIQSLSQVNSGPDIVPYGTSVVTSLSQTISSEDLLNRILISAACGGKLSKFLAHLLRLNELSIESSQNETAVLICDLTLLILTQTVLLFSKQVFLEIVPPAYSNTVFMSQYLPPLTNSVPSHHNIGSNDCLDELLGRIVNKHSIVGFARFRDMIMCLPLAFVELSKARQLSAIDESTIIDVINQVSRTSHSLLLYSIASLVNQARLSPLQLRQKQLHIITCISNISTNDPHRYLFSRDAMMRSIITRLLDTSGLVKKPNPDSEENTSNEPMMVALAKSIESILETGFISSAPFRYLVVNLKFTEPKWLVQKMVGLMFKCSYIEEIAKALSLLHIICHLSLPNLVQTFINESIPDLLHKTVKPTFLAEPRSQSACQLIVWAMAALHEQEGNPHGESIQRLMDKVFVLMDCIYKTNGTNQAIYIMELLVENILELGSPYNRSLLANMPIKLMIRLLHKDRRLFTLLRERENLTVVDVNRVSATLLYKQRSMKVEGESTMT